MSDLRIAVLGWGLRRSLATLAHRPGEGSRLVALADPNPVAQARFREFVGEGATGEEAVGVETVEEALALRPDAVIILTPDDLHEEHAVACLEAGAAVYLEKPMAITVEGCDRILATAQRTGTRLFVGHNMRHFGVVRAMRQLIQSGAIGRPQTAWCRHFVSYGGEAYYRDWHAERSRSTGLLLQKGAHDLDVLHWLCDGTTRRVTAQGKLMVYGDNPHRRTPGEEFEVAFTQSWPPRSLNRLNPVIDVEDVNQVLMELDNGVLASYQHCMFSPDAWRNYTVIGDEGRLENFGDAPGQATVRVWNRAQYYSERGDQEIHVPPAAGTHGGADPAIMREFLAYVRDGTRTETSPLAARMAVATGVAATESVRRGGVPVDVAPLPPSLAGLFE